MQMQTAHQRGPSQPGQHQDEERGKYCLQGSSPAGQTLREDETSGSGNRAREAEQTREERGEQKGQCAGERPLQAPPDREAATPRAGEAIDEHQQRRQQKRGDE